VGRPVPTESPDLHVTLDLLDLAIDAAVEGLSREEVETVTETVWCADYYKMYARRDGKDLDKVTPEDIHYGLEETLYDDRCDDTKHPYFVQAVVQALMAKRRSVGGAYGASEIARDFPDLYRKLREEQLDVTDEGKLIPFGWRSPKRARPLPALPWLGRIAEDDVVTGLEFLEDLRDALGSQSVAELPLLGKRRRWRKMWDDSWDYRRYYETSRDRIANLLKDEGEFKALDRLPEKYPDQERYCIEADPARVAVLIEAFLEEYERRPGVRIKAVRTVPGPIAAPRRPRKQERHPTAMSADRPVPPASPTVPDFDWIDTCEPAIAREAKDILIEIKHVFDLEKDVIRISPYPRGTDDALWRGYHEAQARQRMDVAQMLRKKGIISKAEFEYERGAYGPSGLPRALLIEADRVVAGRCLVLLQARIEGRRKAPSTPVSPGPKMPTQIAASPASELVREYRKEVVGELGRKTGGLIWWLLGALLLAALAIIPQSRNAVVTWVRGAIHDVFSADSTRGK
jgi:hypothetical protein